MSTEVYNVRKKTYADGTQQYMFFSNPRQVGYEQEKKRTKRGEGGQRSKDNSRKRAVQVVYDLAKSTLWDWFITLTFDPQKVHSHDYDECVEFIKKFTRYLQSRHFVYLLVPEKHESGAYHFHGLIKGPLPVSEAYNPWGKPIFDDKGSRVYNVDGYNYGFTTAVKVYSNSAIGYIAKYITKADAVPPERKRYWASRGISRPKVEYLQMYAPEYCEVFNAADYRTEVKGPYGDYEMLEIHGKEDGAQTAK